MGLQDYLSVKRALGAACTYELGNHCTGIMTSCGLGENCNPLYYTTWGTAFGPARPHCVVNNYIQRTLVHVH